MSEKISRSCGSVIYRELENKQREYLLVKGWNREWGFSKGNVERGEDDHEAAKREVKEEVNIDIDFVDGFKEVSRHDLNLRSLFSKKTIKKEVILFLSKVEGDPKIKKQRSEILDYKWLNFEDAYQILTFQDRKQVLENAEKFIIKNSKIAVI